MSLCLYFLHSKKTVKMNVRLLLWQEGLIVNIKLHFFSKSEFHVNFTFYHSSSIEASIGPLLNFYGWDASQE